MLDKDGAEDFVDDIVDGLITSTLDKCFDLYIERQLIPFTVSQAKDAILTIIQVCIMTQIFSLKISYGFYCLLSA